MGVATGCCSARTGVECGDVAAVSLANRIRKRGKGALGPKDLGVIGFQSTCAPKNSKPGWFHAGIQEVVNNFRKEGDPSVQGRFKRFPLYDLWESVGPTIEG